jgi:hypothetical protein
MPRDKNPISNEAMTKLIVTLSRAGEDELADRLHRHMEARAKGADLETMREIWLRS